MYSRQTDRAFQTILAAADQRQYQNGLIMATKHEKKRNKGEIV
jgi:hypothetical protein